MFIFVILIQITTIAAALLIIGDTQGWWNGPEKRKRRHETKVKGR